MEANVPTAAIKARGVLYFMKRSCSCLAKEAIVPLFIALMRPHVECVIQANCSYLGSDIYNLERIQRATTGWLQCVRGLLMKRDSKPQNYRPSKKWIRKDLVLTHEILNNQIDFKFSRRPGLRRSLLRLLQQIVRTHRRRNGLACRAVTYWNRFPLAVVLLFLRHGAEGP